MKLSHLKPASSKCGALSLSSASKISNPTHNGAPTSTSFPGPERIDTWNCGWTCSSQTVNQISIDDFHRNSICKSHKYSVVQTCLQVFVHSHHESDKLETAYSYSVNEYDNGRPRRPPSGYDHWLFRPKIKIETATVRESVRMYVRINRAEIAFPCQAASLPIIVRNLLGSGPVGAPDMAYLPTFRTLFGSKTCTVTGRKHNTNKTRARSEMECPEEV
jgi:hypothetical protein